MGPILPHNRKYLCQAPRPELWEEISLKVLQHATKCQIEQTIEQIQQYHSIEPRLGPGRKSNAEHALQFYRFLLEKIDPDTSGQEYKEEEVMETEDPPKESSTAVPDEPLPSEPSSTPTEQPPKLRSTQCEICSISTDPLIPCSGCHLVFHKDCLRPKLEELPESTWRCPYCILQDENIKRTSKARKQANASVRQLARLKNQFERERNTTTTTTTSVHTNNTMVNDAMDASEPNMAEQDLDQEMATEGEDTTNQTNPINLQILEHPTSAAKEVDGPSTKTRSKSSSAFVPTIEPVQPIQKQEEMKPTADEKDNSATKDPSLMAAAPKTEEDRRILFCNEDEAMVGVDVDEKSEAEKSEVEKRAMELGPSSPERSRRLRKQPMLYDPHLGPQPSVPTKANDPDNENTDNDEDEVEPKGKKGPTKESIRQQAKEGKEDSTFWCSFCKDSADVPLCVFCACRICFGKQDKDSMISCVDCQEEYHPTCLAASDNQRKGEQSWRCPSCANAFKAARRSAPSRTKPREVVATSGSPTTNSSTTNVPSITSTPPSRRSTRNPVQRRPLPMTANSDASAVVPVEQPERKPAPIVAKASGRPRGRPPKNTAAVVPTAVPVPPAPVAPVPVVAPVSVPSRKRGRPPSNSQGGPPRKRGRPPSAATLARRAEEEEARRRDRAESATTEEMDSESVGVSPSAAVTVSRSGRTVKRSTFYDEIAEGAQLMKSGRSRNSPRTMVLPLSDVQAGTEEKPLATAVTAATGASHTSLSGDTNLGPSLPNLKPPPVASSAKDRINPRRKPGARECMQMSRKFGAEVIPDKYMDILSDYCNRGKVEHLIRMRERLDEHSRYLEAQLAGLEALVKEKGESDVVVPLGRPEPEI